MPFHAIRPVQPLTRETAITNGAARAVRRVRIDVSSINRTAPIRNNRPPVSRLESVNGGGREWTTDTFCPRNALAVGSVPGRASRWVRAQKGAFREPEVPAVLVESRPVYIGPDDSASRRPALDERRQLRSFPRTARRRSGEAAHEYGGCTGARQILRLARGPAGGRVRRRCARSPGAEAGRHPGAGTSRKRPMASLGLSRSSGVALRRLPRSTISASRPAPPGGAESEEGALHDCFDRCLSDLPEDSRSLILRYYEGSRPRRSPIAAGSRPAWPDRQRASQPRAELRERLERCVQAVLLAASEPANTQRAMW